MFQRLTTRREVEELIEFHNAHSEFIVLDVETTSVNPREAKLIDVQLSGRGEDEAVIFSADIATVLTNISKSLIIIGHNYKYDAHVLFRHDIDLLSHTWRDTMLIAHLLDENRESYSLDSFVKEFWNDNYKEEFWSKYKSYEEAPEEEKTEYACRDVIFTQRLYRKSILCCETDGIPNSLVEHVHRLQNALLNTEIEGIRVDLQYLQELGVKLKHRIDELEPQMRGLVKDEIELLELEAWQKEIDKRKTDKGKSRVPRPVFSFDSSLQLQSLLYGSLRLPPQRNDKTKAISTDFSSLEKIKASHPVVELIQENRELQKVYTAYVEGTLGRLQYDRESTPRIYPSFRVNGTVTGRISHSNPNLAQLPKTGGVRAIYVPDRGRRLISADFNQLEIIIEGNLSSDPGILRLLKDGISKHDYTARELQCDRDTAKTLNFLLQYWGSHHKIAKLLNCGIDEALSIYNKYWKVYAGAKALKSKTDHMVDKGEPIVNSFGRRRRFDLKKRSPWDKDYRMAYNFLIQSTGADLTSRAFYLVSEWLTKTRYGRGCWTVHDELVVECLEDKCDMVEKKVIDIMTSVGEEINLPIPLKATSSGPMEAWLD